jgi:hypothetical protein
MVKQWGAHYFINISISKRFASHSIQFQKLQYISGTYAMHVSLSLRFTLWQRPWPTREQRPRQIWRITVQNAWLEVLLRPAVRTLLM